MKRVEFGVFFLSSVLALLAACGSDSGNGAEADATAEVKTIHGLGDCKGANEGVTKLVLSENRYYTCEDGEWNVSGSFIDTVKTEDDLPACLSKYEGDSAFVQSEMSVYRCQEGKWKNKGFVMGSYETKSKLPDCEEKFEGLRGFVKNDSAVYVCDGEAWEAWADAYASEDELPNCSSRREGSLAWLLDRGRALVCEDGYWESFSGPAVTGSSSSSRSTPKSSGSEGYDDPWLDDDEVGSSDSESGDGDTESSSSRVSEDSAGSTYDVVTGTLTDSRDGQTYRTVKIGDQVWMAENLNYETVNSWCYDNDPANCAKYGRLYTWAAAMDSVGEWSTNGKGCGYGKECSATFPVRGVCPKGWHLPSQSEWEALIVAVDGSITEYTSSNTAGSKLKSQTGWTAYSGITNEDAFGFSALPAGDGYYGGSCYDEGHSAHFWSSAEDSWDYAYYMGLYYDDDHAYLYSLGKVIGFSVRCLKD